MKISYLSALSATALFACATALPVSAQKARTNHYPVQVIRPASDMLNQFGTDRSGTHYQLLQTTTLPPSKTAKPLDGLGPGGGVSPAQLLSFYNIKKVGGANAIAIIDAFDLPTALTDFNVFSQQFNLPQETSTDPTAATNKVFQQVYQGGIQPANALFYGWDIEEDLDIQWSHAMAPKAKIYLIEAQDNSNANLFAAVDIALTLPKVKEVSQSWGNFEAFDPDAATLSAEHYRKGFGIVYFASTGDVPGLYTIYGYGPSFPASSPDVIAVGGTTEVSDNLTGAYITRLGWEEGDGGPSFTFAQPSYQHNVSNVDPVYRSSPDISAIADPYTGVSVYSSLEGGWGVVGGTSVACPVVAGLTNSAGRWAVDSATELSHIYVNYKKFSDVTMGWNGYLDIKGYDFNTGIGVPNGLTGL